MEALRTIGSPRVIVVRRQQTDLARFEAKQTAAFDQHQQRTPFDHPEHDEMRATDHLAVIRAGDQTAERIAVQQIHGGIPVVAPFPNDPVAARFAAEAVSVPFGDLPMPVFHRVEIVDLPHRRLLLSANGQMFFEKTHN